MLQAANTSVNIFDILAIKMNGVPPEKVRSAVIPSPNSFSLYSHSRGSGLQVPSFVGCRFPSVTAWAHFREFQDLQLQS
jgi:hypothetical protein